MRGKALQRMSVSCPNTQFSSHMTEALDLHKPDLEGLLPQDLESPAVPHSTHVRRSLTIYPQSPLSICSVAWTTVFQVYRRLPKGYAIHLLLSSCRKKHTQHHKTKNKTWQTVSTYKDNRGKRFLITGRLSARRTFSYKATLAGETTNELFPPSPFPLPTGLPPEHTGNHHLPDHASSVE